MPEPTAAATTTTEPAQETEVKQDTLLSTADQEAKAPGQSILDEAGAQEKAQAEAEEKRLLEAKDDELTADERAKKQEITKTKEAEAQKKADLEKSAAVPEKYEFKIPESMRMDEELVKEVTPIFKELKLTQDQAQKVADVWIKNVERMQEKQEADFSQFIENSKQETIKALGPNYKQELVFVARARDRFLSKETQEKLNASGLANDKNLVLDLIKMGRLISEDSVVEGKTAISTAGKSPADILYPTHGQ